MKWRLLTALSAAIILGALFSAYVPDLHGSQTGLSPTDKIMISKAGAVRSMASSAPGFLSGGGLLAAAEDVEFAQPVSHDVTLNIPPVFKCNPFDHTCLCRTPCPVLLDGKVSLPAVQAEPTSNLIRRPALQSHFLSFQAGRQPRGSRRRSTTQSHFARVRQERLARKVQILASRQFRHRRTAGPGDWNEEVPVRCEERLCTQS